MDREGVITHGQGIEPDSHVRPPDPDIGRWRWGCVYATSIAIGLPGSRLAVTPTTNVSATRLPPQTSARRGSHHKGQRGATPTTNVSAPRLPPKLKRLDRKRREGLVLSPSNFDRSCGD